MAFDNLKKALLQGGRDARRELRKNLKRDGKIVSRKTYNSLKVRRNFGFRKFQVTVVGSDVIGFIDQGRRAGAKLPPEGSLLDWMTAKGIKPEAGVKIESLEFLIRRKIARDGISPTNVINRSFRIFEPKVRARIQEAIAIDIPQDIISMIRVSNARAV